MTSEDDVDRKGNQDFKKVHRELYELILESGFNWTDETNVFLRIGNSNALRSSYLTAHSSPRIRMTTF